MKYFILTMDGHYRETGSQVPGFRGISSPNEFRLDRFFETVERIATKKTIKRVLVVRGPEFSAPPFGALEEIYTQLQVLAQTGKDIWYYAPEYTIQDFYLSSACSKRVIHPLGNASFRGFARTGLFFKGLLEKHNINVEVIRCGTYKSAASPFTERKFDDYDREQWQRMLDVLVYQYSDTVNANRKFAQDLLESMMNGKVFSAEDALNEGLVEHVSTPFLITETWKDEKQKQYKLKKNRGSIGRSKRITAVLFHEGAIDEGQNRKSPLLGQVIGDQVMVKEIEKLKKNKKVKAVVFRISSGGGSAVASENILTALKALAQKKLLVISMGPVAGSGGYWIASAGKRLFCSKTSLTGSIGVISMFFQFQNLISTFGVSTDTVRNGEFADTGSSLRPMSEKEHSIIKQQIDSVYEKFLNKTSEARGLDVKQVRQLAEGRLWIGSDAHENGLIDEIGTLKDAVSWAKKEAASFSSKICFYPKIKTSFIQKLVQAKASSRTELNSQQQLQLLIQECKKVGAQSLLLNLSWYSGWNQW